MRVSPLRKPVSCVPPSGVGILLTKEKRFSVNSPVCWMANSTHTPSDSVL